MPRLFTGVEIPSDVGQALGMLRGGLPGARWIDPQNYHLTLRFIGDVDDVIAHEVASMLGRVKRGPFELYMEGLTSFGGESGARRHCSQRANSPFETRHVINIPGAPICPTSERRRPSDRVLRVAWHLARPTWAQPACTSALGT